MEKPDPLILKELEQIFLSKKPKGITYKDLADFFGVKVSTIRKWKSEGLFEILGYRRISRFHKEAILSPHQAIQLALKKLVEWEKRVDKNLR